MTQPVTNTPDFGSVPVLRPRNRDDGAIVAGLILIAVGALVLLAQYVPDVGEYILVAVGVVLLALFLVRRQYGVLIPACIITGVGAGVPLATANPGELGGGLVMISMAAGFLAIWVLGTVFRLPENHWWPILPTLILGTTGAALVAGERGQPLADAVATLWPALLLAAGVALLGQGLIRRPR